MEEYYKKEVERVNDLRLIIYWWNRGRKTLYFDGTVKEFLDKQDFKVETVDNGKGSMVSIVTGSLGVGNFSIPNSHYEEAVKLAIMYYHSYIGDKCKIYMGGKEFSINFHR